MRPFIVDLPKVPKADRPKPLYVRNRLTDDEKLAANDLGWKIVDVRLIHDRGDRVKAILEGAEFGSIELGKDDISWLGMSARVAGLLQTKTAEAEKVDFFQDADLDSLLSIGGKSNTALAPEAPKLKDEE